MDLYVGVDVSLSERPELVGVDRCVSLNRYLRNGKPRGIKRANGRTLIDSGAFSMLKDHGRWIYTVDEFIAHMRHIVAALGPENVAGVAGMDMMCEQIVIEGGDTKDGHFVGSRQYLGLPADATLDDCIREHQRITVANHVEMSRKAPELNVFPTIQGNTLLQYLRCVAMYKAAGVDLTALPLVGLGSVCRRQASSEIDLIVTTLHAMGIRLHGFGVKAQGVEAYGPLLESADSQAWSYAGRRRVGLCPHGVVKHEANCPIAAVRWWRDVSARVKGDAQPALDVFGVVA